MSRERPDYVEKHPKAAVFRPSLARWEKGNSHDWILQKQWMPCRLGKKIITPVPLTAAFLKYMRCLCCPLQCSSFIHFSVRPVYGWEIQFTFCCWGSKPKAGELLLLWSNFFPPYFPYCSAFSSAVMMCLLFNRFSVHSAPKSHQQMKVWWCPLILSIIG